LRYSLDTSAILNSWAKHYPPDVFPQVWDKLDTLANQGTLIASEEVLIELEAKDDDLHRWAKQRQMMFVPTDEAIQNCVSQILRHHPKLVKEMSNRNRADAFVIAVAQVHNCSVVTEENLTDSPDRPRIPDVCQAMGIRCLSMLTLLRDLGCRFI